jgi:alpha-ketoglutarate-dependent taurine dioxygenase
MDMNDSIGWQPLLLTPEEIGVSPDLDGLLAYCGEAGKISQRLTLEKAIVLRGFGLAAGQLESALTLLLPERVPYVYGNSPRSKVGADIYTSTEYPGEFTISLHNELSYAARWPARLLFFCDVAPTAGGATPVTDGARWLSCLDREVRERFSGGITYIQNLHGGYGPGKSWQDTFETADQAVVDAYLAASGATWEWTKGGLRVSQVRPATVRHPATGVEVWFNQAEQWHVATLDKRTRAAITRVMSEAELPQSVRFADGSPIPDDYVQHIHDRGLESAVDVNWSPGDLLLIDNVAVAHGRRPFSGDRRILVAMSS